MYDFDRIVKAAESCDFHGEFASDIKHCENALSMGGLMAINAECWLDVLNAMPDTEIAEYVRTKYKPGLLNPFKGTSLCPPFTGWAALFVKTCESDKMLLTPPTIEIVGFPGLRLVNFFQKSLYSFLTVCAIPIE